MEQELQKTETHTHISCIDSRAHRLQVVFISIDSNARPTK